MNQAKTFGERLRQLRESKGYTLEQLGRLCGASKGNLSKYEHGHVGPNLETAGKLAKALGVSLDNLVKVKSAKRLSKSAA